MTTRAVLCASKHHQPILKMTVQIQGSILYCIKLRIHGTSSSVLPNRLLLIHMLEYVEQHPTLYICRKKHFGMMNMRCIDDALSRWNVGDGHIRHTCSHHSPAKLTWWCPLLDNPYDNAPYWSQRMLCLSTHTINLYSKWPYRSRDPYYISSNWGFMSLHPPSSQAHVLPIHMLEYV